eukprot:3239423-Pyramimonas_sp.AAC.1
MLLGGTPRVGPSNSTCPHAHFSAASPSGVVTGVPPLEHERTGRRGEDNETRGDGRWRCVA